MTLETTLNTKSYVGNSLNHEFSIPFQVAEEEHIYLILKTNNGSEAILSNFSVDLINNIVTYPLLGNAISSSEELTIFRNVPLTQIVDLENAGAFHPKVLEQDGFDRIVMQIQQIAEEVGRSIKVDINSSQTPQELLVRIFDAESTALEKAYQASVSASASLQSEDNAFASFLGSKESEENAKNYAQIAQNWAIGNLEVVEEGSAKYWAEEAQAVKDTLQDLSVSWIPIDSDNINITQGSVTYDATINNLHFNVPRGPQGIQGVAGADGKDGEDGADGSQGVQGAQGDKGEKGEMGDSPFASCFGQFRLEGVNLVMDYVGYTVADTPYIDTETGHLIVETGSTSQPTYPVGIYRIIVINSLNELVITKTSYTGYPMDDIEGAQIVDGYLYIDGGESDLSYIDSVDVSDTGDLLFQLI